MKKVLFITNIPSPYRIAFYSLLGHYVDLTVIFEARGASGIKFNYYDEYKNFKAIFLSDGDINERKVNFGVFKYIRKGYFDYIFLTNYGYATELAAYLKCIFCKINFNLEVDGSKFSNESMLKFLFKKFLFSKPKKIFSPSQTTDSFFRNYGVSSKKIVRYNFTSISKSQILNEPINIEAKNELKRELGLKEIPTILFVGRLIKSKRADWLLETLQLIDRNIQCVIIGTSIDSSYKELLEKLASKVSDVHFIEFLNTEELEKYYKATDLFVFPAVNEVWGLVVNEAMAKGLPVISTIGCVAATELIKNSFNGYVLSENRDSVNLSFFIQEALDNLDTMGKNSLQSVREYSIEKMVSQHLQYMGVDFENFSGDDNI